MRKDLIRDIETGTVYSLKQSNNEIMTCERKIAKTEPFIYMRDPETGMSYKVAVIAPQKQNYVHPCLLSAILQEQLKVSAGCTEISAIAYAVSLAYNAITGSLPFRFRKNCQLNERNISPDTIDRIILTLDRKVYKNAFAVGIPVGNQLHGIELAAALGTMGDPKDELNILNNIKDKNITPAKNLVSRRKVKVQVYSKSVTSPYIKAEISVKGHVAMAIINHHHSNVIAIKLDNKSVYRAPQQTAENPFSAAMRVLNTLSLQQMIELARQVSSSDREYLTKALKVNERISRYGMTHYRNGVSGALQSITRQRFDKGDLVHRTQIETTAAVEARMSGAPFEVMTVAGSGNQGLIATLPINTVANKIGRNENRLFEALALSCLVTAYTTSHTGYLSPLCGCFIKSGLGATAGITYYMKGNENQISSAINQNPPYQN
jgi:L-cysteine desulfidase